MPNRTIPNTVALGVDTPPHFTFDPATALDYLIALSQRGNRYSGQTVLSAAGRTRSDEILALVTAPIREIYAATRAAIADALPQLTDAQLSLLLYEHMSALYNDFQQNFTPMFRNEQSRRMSIIAAAHPLPVSVGSIVRTPEVMVGRMRTAYMRVTALQLQPPNFITMANGEQRLRYQYTVTCESVRPDGTPVTGRNSRSHRFEWTPENCPQPVDPAAAAAERRSSATAARAARRQTIQQQLAAAQQREAELAAQLEALQAAIAESVSAFTAATINRRYTSALQAATRQSRTAAAETRDNCVSRDEE